ncbi:MAG TPA: large conductance mechanosensitive channel protein MscL [Acidimicrobiales bacterium]
MAESKKGILTEFKEFILRGNVVDLAVAVVVGVAFGAMVSALVKDLMTPLIAAIFGKPDFSNLTFTIHDSKFLYGDFINSVITFVSIAAVVFFFVIKPLNFMIERRRRGEGDEETDDRPCPECLSTIPKEAKRCAFCTAEVTPIS